MAKKSKKTAAKQAAKKPGTAVAIHKAQPPAAPQTFLGMLHAIATDKNVDVAKMQAVLDMRAKEDARDAAREYDKRMADVQAALEPIRANLENPQTRSKYASLARLDNAIRPTYSRFGFAISYDTGDAPLPDMVRVLAKVSCAGHSEIKKIDMPADGKGAKGGDVMTKTHATGAAISYGRRYLLAMIFNLIVTKDDDGNGASTKTTDSAEPATITPAQVKRIQALMESTKTPSGRVLDYASKIAKMEIVSIPDIPSSCFDTIEAQLKALAK